MMSLTEPNYSDSRAAYYAALAERQGAALTERLRRATVAVCGLGGLGSHIAPALARAGIGRLLLIDFDRVELSNIHRQQYKLAQIGRPKAAALAENIAEAAPFTEIISVTERLDKKNAGLLLSGADAVCEAFDDPEAKAMLTDFMAEQLPEVFLAAASGMAGLGPGNAIRTRRLTEHFVLCGDEVSEVTSAATLLAPRVMLCASHQALAVLRYLAGETAETAEKAGTTGTTRTTGTTETTGRGETGGEAWK